MVLCTQQQTMVNGFHKKSICQRTRKSDGIEKTRIRKGCIPFRYEQIHDVLFGESE